MRHSALAFISFSFEISSDISAVEGANLLDGRGGLLVGGGGF